jgi:hypothetical protein
MHAWKSQNYGSNFQNNYSSPADNLNHNSNSNNNGVSGSNLDALESSLKSFMNSENQQNKMLMKITENHDTLIAKLSNQDVSMKSDMQDLRENQYRGVTTGQNSEESNSHTCKICGKS